MTLSNIWHQKHKQFKKEIGKLDFIQIKIFCASKDTIKKVKRQATEWEEIISNHVFDNSSSIQNI